MTKVSPDTFPREATASQRSSPGGRGAAARGGSGCGGPPARRPAGSGHLLSAGPRPGLLPFPAPRGAAPPPGRAAGPRPRPRRGARGLPGPPWRDGGGLPEASAGRTSPKQVFMEAACTAAAQRPRARPHAPRARRRGGRVCLGRCRWGRCSRPGCPGPHLTRACRPSSPPPRARSSRPAAGSRGRLSSGRAQPGVPSRPRLLRRPRPARHAGKRAGPAPGRTWCGAGRARAGVGTGVGVRGPDEPEPGRPVRP